VPRHSPEATNLSSGFKVPAGDPLPNLSPQLLTLDLRCPPPGQETSVPMVEVTAIRHQGWFDPSLNRNQNGTH